MGALLLDQPWAKPGSLLPVFINKVLLRRSHALSLLRRLRLLSRGVVTGETVWPMELKVCTIWPFRRKAG